MGIQITVNQKGLRADTVEKIVKAALQSKYPEATVLVTRKDPPESRAERFAEAQSLASDAKTGAEELRDELQDWRDNLPENLQSGSKADELDQAISDLEEFISSCEDAEGASVEFPSMM